MRFNGGLLMMGLGGVVGKWLGDALVGSFGALGGWGGVIVRFVLGALAMGWRGGGNFALGFGVVNVADAVSGALAQLGVTLPALRAGAGA